MMFKIQDGRKHFYQWDLGQKLIVPAGMTCDQVHFYNKTLAKALVCEVYAVDGRRLVDVPNSLLQTALPIRVSAYVCNGDKGKRTQTVETFFVYERPRPDDYVYTETETRTWDALETRIAALEGRSDSSNTVASEVVTLRDQSTGTDYTLYVTAGKLTMDVAETPTESAEGVSMVDTATGKTYVLYVSNGKLNMKGVDD